jgi:fatty acid desaturase
MHSQMDRTDVAEATRAGETGPDTTRAPMLPNPAALRPAVDPRLRPDGRPTGDYRDELRRIPNLRNAAAVLSCWVQTIAVVVAAVWIAHPAAWIAAVVLVGRSHAMFAALMHEAAHRLLFRNRALNDFVGRWLLGFPTFTPIDSYRRGHMAHHREEFGPNEPDIPLYRGYPISRASFRRKLTRDITGRTGWTLFKGLFRGLRAEDRSLRFQAWGIVASQLVLIAVATAFGRPWLWLVLWWIPHLTVWRVINRLRAIAEHGGMVRASDRRDTTHTVRQHLVARALMVPYRIGWHLAHHVDSGVPMFHLPRYHRALVESGYINPDLEYPNYRTLWRKLASG